MMRSTTRLNMNKKPSRAGGFRLPAGLAALAALGLLLGAAPATAPSAAPDFQLHALDGTPVSLSDLRGRTVVLHFWATWCPHCLSEMPILEEAAPKL